MKTHVQLWYINKFFLEEEIYQIYKENYTTHYMFYKCYSKICHLWDKLEKSGRDSDDTNDNIAHAHCMQNNWVYKNKLRICNSLWFSTATIIIWTRRNVTYWRVMLPS